MNCDNQTVIIKVNSSKDNMKLTWHVKGRLESIRKLRNSRVIALDYVHTSKNLADRFTKRLSHNGHVRFSYNPYFLASFFSWNSVFSLTTNQQNSASACFFSEANGAIIF